MAPRPIEDAVINISAAILLLAVLCVVGYALLTVFR